MFALSRLGTITQWFACACGITVIASASALNVIHDLAAEAKETLPSFVAASYEFWGKTGVTLFLTVVGLGMLLLGFAVPRRRDQTAPEKVAVPPRVAYFGPATASVGEIGEIHTRAGVVTLQTAKYLAD